ncbi:hypothetical protein P8A22_23290 [Streptomyces laculatispora]|uniref:Uncharacterized protein n=1 Tax=Streptomyces laculatispora TaxID=887464 RepID=A0ABY9I7F7_9ACTN|nr:hypothetical protein [Streptomyces laculatispora]WLQ42609.1 hypothetical protein P8A22_23290 [Streptomyces laculatispora]
MRRALISLGSLAAAGMLALAMPQSAFAANGTLVVNGVAYENPGPGCYPAGDDGAQIDNRTDTDVEVFADPACEDGPVTVISAYDSGSVAPGGSIKIA